MIYFTYLFLYPTWPTLRHERAVHGALVAQYISGQSPSSSSSSCSVNVALVCFSDVGHGSSQASWLPQGECEARLHDRYCCIGGEHNRLENEHLWRPQGQIRCVLQVLTSHLIDSGYLENEKQFQRDCPECFGGVRGLLSSSSRLCIFTCTFFQSSQIRPERVHDTSMSLL